MSFSDDLRAYEEWKQSRGSNWHSPERYEEWFELNVKASAWDNLRETWENGGIDEVERILENNLD
jgi:hypothetical protein